MKYLPPRSYHDSSSGSHSCSSRGALFVSDKDIITKDHGTYWDQLPAESRDLPPLWRRIEQQDEAQRLKQREIDGTGRHGLLDVLLGPFGW